MRLAAQLKGGFYPAPPEVVRQFASKLDVTDPKNTFIMDPCAGRGEAIDTVASTTGCPLENVHAVELDVGRAADVAERLPGATVLGPADFLTAEISSAWSSCIWLNPPFDDEIGGGRRTEASFLVKATRMLTIGGVLAFVLPEYVFERERAIRQHAGRWYDDAAWMRFPKEHRSHGEIIVVGRKRSMPLEKPGSVPDVPFDGSQRWTVPKGSRPRLFAKGGPTESELLELIGRSPLRRLTEPPAARRLARPPIPLSSGHVSLMLSCGHLDGVVQPPNEPPHVVRGSAHKERYLAESNDDGETTTTVYRERLVPILRAIDASGMIRSFASERSEAS